MYGTRDAASSWERDWQGLSRNLFHNKKKKISVLTHDRIEEESVGAQEAAGERVPKQSEHHQGRFGKEYQGAEWENVLGRDTCIGSCVQTPIVDDVKDDSPVWLDPVHISNYRCHVARCLFLSQDTADITFAVNELCQRMSDPSQHSFTKLKRLVLYLKGERQCIQVFEFGNMSSEVTVFFDSDCAGDKRSEEIVKRRTALAGRHFESVYTKTEDLRQKQCRSSAEAELYAAALGTSEAKASRA